MTNRYDDIAAEVARHGLALRGGFTAIAGDGVPHVSADVPTHTLLMIGNTGRAMWDKFSSVKATDPNPLDRWTREVIEPIAVQHGARAVYPYDVPPLPFQRWAARAWPLSASPLGLLIDTEFGLWHALRAALLFPEPVALPPPDVRVSPCASCAEKPCLTSCPVDAFTNSGFDYVRCRAYLATPEGNDCLANGCKARLACPIGVPHRYGDAQMQFHMRSYSGITRKR